MTTSPLSPRELRVWHAFLLMGEDVLARVGRDILQATGLSGAEFGLLSRLAAIGKGAMRQQELARVMGWEKSRLSHQLTRMEKRKLVERRVIERQMAERQVAERQTTDGRATLVVLTDAGREKLESARPIHARSVRRNLLSRLSAEQIETMVRVSNILGADEDEAEDEQISAS